MEYITLMEKRVGVDLGRINTSNLCPLNSEGCNGKYGLDKNLGLPEVLEIAYRMEEKPNIIIKGGAKAKWYLKTCPKSSIDSEIEKQRKWRDTSRCTMWIIDWDN